MSVSTAVHCTTDLHTLTEALRTSMAETGLQTHDRIIADGKVHRVHIIGDRPKTRNGWYVLYSDNYPAGAFGCHKRGVKRTWSLHAPAELSQAERAQLRANQQAAKAAAEAEACIRREQVTRAAQEQWEAAEAASPLHPYLAQKGVGVHSIKQRGNKLLIPVQDGQGVLHGLQTIDAAGAKFFLSGTSKRAHYHLIGDPEDVIVVAEGYATAASIHEATQYPVAVAFDAGNLQPVAESLRRRNPTLRIILAADTDREKAGNVGLEAATAAARAVNGPVVVPPFADDEPGSDWNDYALRHGTDALLAAFRSASFDRPTAQPSAGAPGGTGATSVDVPEYVAKAADPAALAAGAAASVKAFSVDNAGVWYEPPSDSEKEPEPPIWVCSTLYITAQTRDPARREWGKLLEFPDPDGTWHRWVCPMELLASDGADFRRALLSRGLQISAGGRRHLGQYVQSAQPLARATCVSRTGWHERAYVLPDCVVGDHDEEILLQTEVETGDHHQRGSLEAWRTEVAAMCAGNSRLLLAVSMSFAPFLIEPLGEECGGIHLVGASSTGKTTALRVAASVHGGPRRVYRWRATTNGLEAVAALHNDSLLVLDELAQVDAREAGAVAYMLANGTGKHRATKSGQSRTATTWRLLFLSAGEIALSEHMLEAGRRTRAGQELRLADVPADAGAGRGVFEDLHGYATGAALADALHRAVQHNHGTASRAFLARMVAEPEDDLRATVNEIRSRFVSNAVPEGCDGQVHRVAARFSMIAVAGELATRWGITGWHETEALAGVKLCFDAWMERRGGHGSQEEATALAQALHFLEAHGDARFADLDAPNRRAIAHRAGYRRRFDEATVEYFILGEVFRKEVCAGLDFRFVANVLKLRGLLQTNEADRWTVKQHGLGRVYHIRIEDSAAGINAH